MISIIYIVQKAETVIWLTNERAYYVTTFLICMIYTLLAY